MANDTLPIPRIEVLQYNGYNGGFAIQRVLLWRCDVINASGIREVDIEGNTNKRYAVMDADIWKKRTLWPVFDVGRQPLHDETPRG